jgi:hypothetical protein
VAQTALPLLQDQISGRQLLQNLSHPRRQVVSKHTPVRQKQETRNGLGVAGRRRCGMRLLGGLH